MNESLDKKQIISLLPHREPMLLIDELYNIVKQALQLINDKVVTESSYYYTKYMEIFPKVIEGIRNYQMTYKDDAYITSRCNVIIDGINSVINSR